MKEVFLKELLAQANRANDWKAILICIKRSSEWKLLARVCRKKPQMDADSFEVLMQMYVRFKSMKRDAPDVVRDIEDLMFMHDLLPVRITSAKDVKLWNYWLEKFFIASGECEEDDFIGIESCVFEWWQTMLRKHHCVTNVFKMMENSTLSADGSSVWQGAFSNEELFRGKFYKALLTCGQVEFLLDKGKSDFVIDHFDQLRIAGDEKQQDKDLYAAFSSLVTENELMSYLRRRTRNFHFFVMHPKGLEVLLKAGCLNAIDNMSAEFIANAQNFPASFNVDNEAEAKYVKMLKGALTRNLSVVS